MAAGPGQQSAWTPVAINDECVGLVVIAAGYVVIEALVRRRFLRLLLDLTIVLAIVGAAILLYSSLVLFVALGLVIIGFIILRDNVRELRQA